MQAGDCVQVHGEGRTWTVVGPAEKRDEGKPVPGTFWRCTTDLRGDGTSPQEEIFAEADLRPAEAQAASHP